MVCDLAGAPKELINPVTGEVVGYATYTLFGKRQWAGMVSTPLLFTGQYEDTESGWVYNRFRYYDPHAGVYNAQDPLGLLANLGTAQGYVTNPVIWVDILGLKGCKRNRYARRRAKKSGERAVKLHERMIEVYKRERIADDTAKRYNVAMAMDSHGRIYFAMGATRDLNPSLHTVETLRGSKIVTTADTGLGEMPAVTDPKQERLLFHAEQKLLAFAQKNNIELVEIHSVFKVCEDDYLPARSCSSVLREHGFVALKGGPTQYQGRIYFKAETLARIRKSYWGS